MDFDEADDCDMWVDDSTEMVFPVGHRCPFRSWVPRLRQRSFAWAANEWCSDYTRYLDEYGGRESIRAAIAPHVFRDPITGCVRWMGDKHSSGHGYVVLQPLRGRIRREAVHRLMMACSYGEFPGKLSVRHKCGVADCCNPFHLCLGNHVENVRDQDLHCMGRLRVAPFDAAARLIDRVGARRVAEALSSLVDDEVIAARLHLSVKTWRRIRPFLVEVFPDAELSVDYRGVTPEEARFFAAAPWPHLHWPSRYW